MSVKLGFMIYSLSRALADESITVPGALALMKELGAEGVDVTPGHMPGYTPADIHKAVSDAGLVVSCYIGGANLTMSDPDQRTESLDQVRTVIDAAAQVEAVNVLVTTGACAEGQDRSEGRRNVAAGLAELLPYAADAGMTLSIEDFGSPLAPYQTSDECLDCCALAGEGLMMTYDSGNMVLGDEDPVDFLRNVEHLMVHAHAKDWEALPPEAENCLTSRAGRKYVGTVVGQGVLDYPAIIGRLKEIGYDGFLSFEYEGRNDPVEAAREGMAYLRGLMEAPA